MEKSKQKSVVIVAGGKGSRMNSEMPKQFLLVAGKPILMQTILRFYNCFRNIQIVVVLPFDQIEAWNRIISGHRFIIPHQITPGGKERFHSVKNGLSMIDDEGLVAIHDGVRPLVAESVIKESFRIAARAGGAIPVVKPTESIRKITSEGSTPVVRDDYRLVQTPQTFDAGLLKKAYEQPWEPRFTDDATVFEADGNKVELFEGNRENIKITDPFDLKIAENTILKSI